MQYAVAGQYAGFHLQKQIADAGCAIRGQDLQA
jgi:hypothetical protein